MILDVLENARRYVALNHGFAKAFEFLTRPDVSNLPEGRHDIDGDRVYAIVTNGPGRKRQDALLETHEKYIDIQLIVAGTDDIGWKPKSSCRQPSGKYDPESDFQFFADEADAWISTGPGAFVVFFADDAHLPTISSGNLHKIVAKVAIDQK